MRRLRIRNKYVANAGWILAGRSFQVVLSMIVSVLIARYLGPSNYGVINYVASYVAFFTSLTTLGLSSVIVKYFVSKKDEQGKYVGTAIGMRLISSVVSMVFLQALMAVLEPGDRTIQIITILQSIVLIFASFDIITYWYQSRLESKYVAIITSVTRLIAILYKVAILILNKSVEWFAFSSTIDYLLVGIALYVAYHRSSGQKLSFSLSAAKELLSECYPYIISGVMSAVYAQISKILTGNMIDTTAVGLLTVATGFCDMISFIPVAITDSLRPLVMESKLQNERRYVYHLKILMAVILWGSILLAVGITLFAPLVVVLLYGPAYADSAAVLRVYIWSCVFAFIGPVKNIWLICEKKARYEQVFTLTGAVVSVALNLLLIPRIGIVGSAAATILAQMASNFLIPACFKNTRAVSGYMLEALIFKGVPVRDALDTLLGRKTRNDSSTF
jgi:O-antigen/teichoic acid export membrane protein